MRKTVFFSPGSNGIWALAMEFGGFGYTQLESAMVPFYVITMVTLSKDHFQLLNLSRLNYFFVSL